MTSEEVTRKIWQDILNQIQSEEQTNQRLPGEIDVDEFLAIGNLNLSRDAAMKRLNRMVQIGKLSKRVVVVSGVRVCLFKPVD